MIKKYNNISKNITGEIIKENREKQKISRIQLSNRLELLGIYLDRNEIRLIENNDLMIKDFELIALAKILNIDLNNFKTLFD